MVHIWHEDSMDSSTTKFWEFIRDSKICKKLDSVDIRGFDGNNKLLQHLEITDIIHSDTYYILLDTVPDNMFIIESIKAVKEVCKKHKNVIYPEVVCFEYFMLMFKDIVNWTSKNKSDKGYSEAVNIRRHIISCMHDNKSWEEDEVIVKYLIRNKNKKGEDADRYIENTTLEQISTLLLSKITGGGPLGFQITKTIFGRCWTCSCKDKCDHSIYTNNKNAWRICRLNTLKYKKTSVAKAYDLWVGTDAHNIIK